MSETRAKRYINRTKQKCGIVHSCICSPNSVAFTSCMDLIENGNNRRYLLYKETYCTIIKYITVESRQKMILFLKVLS